MDHAACFPGSPTGNGAAIDYGAIEHRIADVLGEVERGLHAQVLAHLDIDVPAIRGGATSTAALAGPHPRDVDHVPAIDARWTVA